MANSISIHFRPVETKIIEVQYSESGSLYRIETKVRFFTDEAMTKVAYEKEYIFEQIPYEPSWDGILGEIYQLITKNI